ncbi:fungal-specific transcription factor domain-containing protein [Aspergillus novoparasiticus]|uniref:Fungal-specific transcription factor domain-containing protein n=1 Tax=Aspergillus novoparasiticus TaxID=986946 RepID=A0A5N6EH85_9EURO|nr:fungal-specific transcription factor domain-containing protein [Aspergillus novoparasiticus]
MLARQLSGMDHPTVSSGDSGLHSSLTYLNYSERDGQAGDDNTDEAVSSTTTPNGAFSTRMADDWISPASSFHVSRDGDGSKDAGCGWWLTVPEQVLTELVYLFFDKIQGWLPLLHRPRFFDCYMKNGLFDKRCPSSFSNAESLLLCGMFALAVRHSLNPYFQECSAQDRGQRFAEDANKYYEMARTAEQGPTLRYLQGCILLTCYQYASGPSHRAWILAGDCVRLAYDLNLCNMDEQQNDCPDPGEWSFLEEQRRAFWLVWEVDTFGSVISRRPSSINRSMMAVRLPVGDATWFANNPVQSPVLDPRPSAVWEILIHSPNQDERAWYLVANFLMTIASEFAAGRHTCARDKDELVDAITCYSLVISQRFSLESLEFSDPSNQAGRHNWVIGMYLMVVCSRATIRASFGTHGPGMPSFSRHMSRIFYQWQPEYISLSQPFLACCLLSDLAYPSKEAVQSPDTSSQGTDMVELVLLQYASVWKLGSVLSDLREILIHGEHASAETSFKRRFALYFPPRINSSCPDNPNVDQSGLTPGSNGNRTRKDNGSNEDNAFPLVPGQQHLSPLPTELEQIEPKIFELSNISSGQLPNILRFNNQDERMSRDLFDYVI